MPVYSDTLDVMYTVTSSELLKLATDSEAWAIGKRDGVDVDSEDEAYQNNSKYYATLAASTVEAEDILEIVDKAAYHNSIFRGKSLGSQFTQHNAISDGSFNDLYIGDYWTIDGIKYYIADFMYWYGKGSDTDKITDNHICVVSQVLGSSAMAVNADTELGYMGTEMYSDYMSTYTDLVNSAFGANAVLPRPSLLSSAFSNGSVSYTDWADDVYVDLMTQPMVCGNYPIGNGYSSLDYSQLSLFRLSNRMANELMANESTPTGFWFRDPVTDSDFAYFTPNGYVDRCEATATRGVVVAFAIS